MNIKQYDAVVLTEDIPNRDLKAGDMGAVVDVYAPDAFEVEFVTASGRTQALVTLTPGQIRLVGSNDLLTVRQLNAA